MKKIILYSLMLAVTLLESCGGGEKKQTELAATKTEAEVQKVKPPSIGDTALYYDYGKSFEVLVKAPKSPFKGTILVLQGWNFPNTSWCDSSELCQKASEAGYFLVMPAMEKSIFHHKAYEQTRKDWAKNPTRDWLMNTVCKDLEKKYGLFSSDHNNYVMGLSTGGRGALIIAEENPEMFAAGASLSGDYDQSAFSNDNLYRGYFGSNPDNWNSKENPISFIDNWKVPMFIGHGRADVVVSVQHAIHLQQLTEGLVPHLKFEYSFVEEAGHDYTYWSSQVHQILEFFEKHRNIEF